MREKALVRAFDHALIVGGQNGLSKAIEVHAHDSQRYVGDILAWTHQASLSELEMLENLFGMAISSEKQQNQHQSDSPFLNVEGYSLEVVSVREALDKNMRGTGKTMKVSFC